MPSSKWVDVKEGGGSEFKSDMKLGPPTKHRAASQS